MEIVPLEVMKSHYVAVGTNECPSACIFYIYIFMILLELRLLSEFKTHELNVRQP